MDSKNRKVRIVTGIFFVATGGATLCGGSCKAKARDLHLGHNRSVHGVECAIEEDVDAVGITATREVMSIL